MIRELEGKMPIRTYKIGGTGIVLREARGSVVG
jgi:hypothetical protein